MRGYTVVTHCVNDEPHHSDHSSPSLVQLYCCHNLFAKISGTLTSLQRFCCPGIVLTLLNETHVPCKRSNYKQPVDEVLAARFRWIIEIRATF